MPTYADLLQNALNGYNVIMPGWENALSSQRANQSDIVKGYSSLYNNVLGGLENVGKSEQQRITDEYEANKGAATQNLTSRGLGNTTVTSAVQRGVDSNKDKAQLALADKLAQLKAGYQSDLGKAGLSYGNQANMQDTALQLAGLGYQAGFQGLQGNWGMQGLGMQNQAAMQQSQQAAQWAAQQAALQAQMQMQQAGFGQQAAMQAAQQAFQAAMQAAQNQAASALQAQNNAQRPNPYSQLYGQQQNPNQFVPNPYYMPPGSTQTPGGASGYYQGPTQGSGPNTGFGGGTGPLNPTSFGQPPGGGVEPPFLPPEKPQFSDPNNPPDLFGLPPQKPQFSDPTAPPDIGQGFTLPGQGIFPPAQDGTQNEGGGGIAGLGPLGVLGLNSGLGLANLYGNIGGQIPGYGTGQAPPAAPSPLQIPENSAYAPKSLPEAPAGAKSATSDFGPGQMVGGPALGQKQAQGELPGVTGKTPDLPVQNPIIPTAGQGLGGFTATGTPTMGAAPRSATAPPAQSLGATPSPASQDPGIPGSPGTGTGAAQPLIGEQQGLPGTISSRTGTNADREAQFANGAKTPEPTQLPTGYQGGGYRNIADQQAEIARQVAANPQLTTPGGPQNGQPASYIQGQGFLDSQGNPWTGTAQEPQNVEGNRNQTMMAGSLSGGGSYTGVAPGGMGGTQAGSSTPGGQDMMRPGTPSTPGQGLGGFTPGGTPTMGAMPPGGGTQTRPQTSSPPGGITAGQGLGGFTGGGTPTMSAAPPGGSFRGPGDTGGGGFSNLYSPPGSGPQQIQPINPGAQGFGNSLAQPGGPWQGAGGSIGQTPPSAGPGGFGGIYGGQGLSQGGVGTGPGSTSQGMQQYLAGGGQNWWSTPGGAVQGLPGGLGFNGQMSGLNARGSVDPRTAAMQAQSRRLEGARQQMGGTPYATPDQIRQGGFANAQQNAQGRVVTPQYGGASDAAWQNYQSLYGRK